MNTYWTLPSIVEHELFQLWTHVSILADLKMGKEVAHGWSWDGLNEAQLLKPVTCDSHNTNYATFRLNYVYYLSLFPNTNIVGPHNNQNGIT